MTTGKAYKGVAMEGPIASWYAKNTRNEARHRPMAERIAGLLATGSRVLEIAPGPGYFAIELARLGPYQVTGVDISKSFVEIARQNAAQAGVAVDFRLGNASDLPCASETFDFTICQAAFKNFAQPVRAIAEMHRVLRSPGTALIVDLRRNASRAEVQRHVQSMGLNPLNRWLTAWTFRAMLLKSAYSVDEIRTMAAQTPFRQARIETDAIGFMAWLEK